MTLFSCPCLRLYHHLDRDISPIYIASYRRIVEVMSKALLNQEKRNRYVSKQIALMLRLQEESTQKIHVNQTHQNNLSHEGSNLKKKNTTSMTSNSNNEITTSVKKKNKAPDVQPTNSLLAVSVTDNIFKTSQSNSLTATPTNRSSSIIDIPSTAGLNSSSSGALYPGVWAATPTRVASPPISLMESGSIVSNLMDNKDINTSGVLGSSAGASLANIAGTPVTGLVSGGGLGIGGAGAYVSHPNSAHNLILSVAAMEKNENGNNRNTGNGITGLNGGLQAGSGKRPGFDKKLQVMESMQTQSSLANELRLVYHGLIGKYRLIFDTFFFNCMQTFWCLCVVFSSLLLSCLVLSCLVFPSLVLSGLVAVCDVTCFCFCLLIEYIVITLRTYIC